MIGDCNSQPVHGGGNYHLDSSVNVGFATELIVNENQAKGEAGVIQIWKDFQNLDTVITDPFPTNVDGTQHIGKGEGMYLQKQKQQQQHESDRTLVVLQICG